MPRKFLIEHKDNIARLMAEGLNARQVAAELGLRRASVLTFAKTHNLGEWKSATGPAPWTPPVDFDDLWQSMTGRRLAAGLGVTPRMISAEARRRGLSKAIIEPRAKPPKPEPKRTRTGIHVYQAIATKNRYERDMTLIGQAADRLSREGPIYRCGPNRIPDKQGKYWNRGGYLLTDADVISRAERLGWRFVAF